VATAEALADIGVGLSLDDFGTGYSSLLRLKRLPFSEVKVDSSFIGRLLESPDDEVVVKSILDLAAALGIRSVAEGVESAEVASTLLAMGCVAAQGWHFARPMNAVSATAWLTEHVAAGHSTAGKAPAGSAPAGSAPAGNGAAGNGAAGNGAAGNGAGGNGAAGRRAARTGGQRQPQPAAPRSSPAAVPVAAPAGVPAAAPVAAPGAGPAVAPEPAASAIGSREPRSAEPHGSVVLPPSGWRV
jgi:hypothetical protein